MRLMWESIAELNAKLATFSPHLANDRERFEAAFGLTLYLHPSRGDEVAQAVSRLKAEQTALWHLAADGSERERSAPPADPVYHARRIEHYLMELRAHNIAWKRWFESNAIVPFNLTYETLAANPRDELERILLAIGKSGFAARQVEMRATRMADTTSLDWIARFRASQEWVNTT